MFKYYNPVAMHFDVDMIEILKTLPPRLLLVTSAHFARSGCVDMIKQHADIVHVIDYITPNPELDFLQNLKKTLQPHDAILAVGGGSVIDSAKFLSLKADIVASHAALHIQNLRAHADIFAFPSTSGSGSEITPWATVWDKGNGIKYSLQHEMLFSKAAFYDCKLMLSMPQSITLISALDSLSHAFESIWNKNHNPVATMNALRCIELTLENLPKLVRNLDNIHLRYTQMLASLHASLAFSSTQTALAHAISYPLTMQLGLAHGLACSFSLPLLLRHCTPHSKAILEKFAQPLQDMFAELGVATRPADYGITKEFAKAIFSSLNERAKNALLDVDSIYEDFILHSQ